MSARSSPLPRKNKRTVVTLSDERDQLLRAIDGLPYGQKAVLLLRFYEDLTVDQTAELLGCSVGTVKSRTARGLRQLRMSPQLDPLEGR